jgi:hypothetical protein
MFTKSPVLSTLMPLGFVSFVKMIIYSSRISKSILGALTFVLQGSGFSDKGGGVFFTPGLVASEPLSGRLPAAGLAFLPPPYHGSRAPVGELGLLSRNPGFLPFCHFPAHHQAFLSLDFTIFYFSTNSFLSALLFFHHFAP